MKTYFNQKIITGLLIFSIFFSISFSIFPQKTNALFGAGDVVIDPTNLVQNTTSAVATNYQAFVKPALDKVAIIIAKQMIRMITYSVVNWINSGFQGSPAFLQNPGAFFMDVGDQITGEFISKFGGPLSQLCSPFSIDIRLALALKLKSGIQKRYACTLSTLVKNSSNAINGFTAGNFRDGGWPVFVSLTTEPQNNIYGAFLQADSDLSLRIIGAQGRKQNELTMGSGFLSWRDPKCTKSVAEYNAKVKSGTQVSTGEGSSEGQTMSTLKSANDCPIQTPGSTIAGSLQNNLNGPLRELELVDNMNQVVNALFSQLVVQVLQKGLTSVSSSGSNGTTYLNETVADLKNQNSPEIKAAKAQLSNTIATYMQPAIDYKKNRDDAVTIMTDIKAMYLSAIACYQAKIDVLPPNGYRTQIQINQSNLARIAIDEMNQTIKNIIDPKIASLSKLALDSVGKSSSLSDMQNQIDNASDINTLNQISQQYSLLVQGKTVITTLDVQNSRNDLDAVRADSTWLKQDAMSKLQSCQYSIN